MLCINTIKSIIQNTSGIAFQFGDSLLSFTKEKDIAGIMEVIDRTPLSIISKDDSDWDIASWSTNTDILIQFGDELIICIPKVVL